MTIGDSIRAARKSRGLTQNELAHAMGITGAAIGQYECGIRIPKYETVERIASALSVPTSSLMPVVSSEIEHLIDRCARYAEEIAVAQERTRWVPVEERLPEISNSWGVSDIVLCIISDPSGYPPPNPGLCVYLEDERWTCHGQIVRVTHWMPLPAPPEEER